MICINGYSIFSHGLIQDLLSIYSKYRKVNHNYFNFHCSYEKKNYYTCAFSKQRIQLKQLTIIKTYYFFCKNSVAFSWLLILGKKKTFIYNTATTDIRQSFLLVSKFVSPKLKRKNLLNQVYPMQKKKKATELYAHL